jgi:hypothetical protein
MRIRYLIISSLLFFLVLPLSGQNDDDSFRKALNNINESVLKAQLGFLASDWTEGRMAGEKGEYLASEFIASLLQLCGVKPGGDFSRARGIPAQSGKSERTYFQNFILLKTSPGEEQAMKIKTVEGTTYKSIYLLHNVDFSVRSGDQGIEIEAPVVFAGYGFRNEKLRYDDFSKLDLKGKFLLKISGSPGFAREALSPSELSAGSREVEGIARKMGAVGIIEINPNSVLAGNQPGNEFLNMSPSEENPFFGREWADYSLPGKKAGNYLPRISISVKDANEILTGTGFDLDEFIRRSELEPPVNLPVIKGKSIYLKTTLKQETVRVRNVIGVIEGKTSDQIILLGAHYDHLGSANGYIWNGADDNGSGTVGVMTIAKAIMESGIKPSKTIIIALWSAEEEGLLGSRHYVENLQYPLSNLRLNVNFDMISRYTKDDDPKKVSMIYTESFPAFRSITEENLKKYGIDLDVDFQPSKDPPGGSDHRSFVEAGVPVMRFKPGHREEYHTPADEISTVDWDIMEKVIKISLANIWKLANTSW